MSDKARAHFRLIQMPCCGQLLCWVNPRIPNYCPECGKFAYAILKEIHPECILISDPNAWVEYHDEHVKKNLTRIGEALAKEIK